MEDTVLEIQLFPSFNSTAKNMGYDLETDDVDSDAVGFQQGADIDVLTVEAGEKFEITADFENGSISNEDRIYKVMKNVFFGDREKKMILESEDEIVLEPGKYLFHADGITIEEIGELSFDETEED